MLRFIIHQFRLAKFFASLKETSEKQHKKVLGKAWKSGAEGESLKLLKESGAIFSLRT